MSVAHRMFMLFHGNLEASVARGGGGVFGDAQFLVTKAHDAVVVEVLGAVGGEEVVELVEEVLRAYVDNEFVAEVVLLVELEGEAVVGGVDDHDAVHIVASRHVGDVECLAFSSFVAHKGTEALDDVVRVAAKLLRDVVGLCLGKEACRN